MDSFYQIILAAHNLLRWVILIFGILTIITSLTALLGKKNWDTRISKFGLYYTISLDTQLLLGLLLYFVFSPLTKSFFSNIGNSMGNDTLRFFGMEHFLIMLVAVVIAHMGSAARKKAISDDQKVRRAAILFGISFLLVLSGIPWASRPLLPTL